MERRKKLFGIEKQVAAVCKNCKTEMHLKDYQKTILRVDTEADGPVK